MSTVTVYGIMEITKYHTESNINMDTFVKSVMGLIKKCTEVKADQNDLMYCAEGIYGQQNCFNNCMVCPPRLCNFDCISFVLQIFGRIEKYDI